MNVDKCCIVMLLVILFINNQYVAMWRTHSTQVVLLNFSFTPAEFVFVETFKVLSNLPKIKTRSNIPNMTDQ